MDVNKLKGLIKQLIGKPLLPWEQEYLNYHAARFADTLDLLGQGEGKRLLDIGAFPGHLTLATQALGYEIQALTGRMESARGLNTFTERLANHQIPLALADVECEPFPFPDKFFDVVLAAEIIEHLPYNPYHMLREAFRVLKPKGRLILTTPNISKLDNLLHFIRGRTIHPDIRLPFHKTFKSILIGRHIREYTSSELIYMLEEQNKEMYRFEGTGVSYSMCLDPAFSWAGAIPWLVKRFWPRFQSTLFLEAFRPEGLELVLPGDMTTNGFFDVEEQAADMGSTGRILATPFRWTEGKAVIYLPAGKAGFPVFYLHLIFMAPRYLSPVILNIRLGDCRLGRVCIPPGREYVPLRLALPAHLAVDGLFNLCWESSTWRPADHAQGVDYYEFSTSDTRELGIAVAWDGVLREECTNQQELQHIARRECGRSRLREGNEPRWSPLSGLYLVQAKLKPSLSIGPGDWVQLGSGWHALEQWKQGWMRWSSRSSEVYLDPGPEFGRLGIRVYTGDKALEKGINGVVKIEWAPDRLAFSHLKQQTFDLPSDHWIDLEIELPPLFSPGGVLRVLIEVNNPRIPADLMPGSQDRRELGLAIFSLVIKE